METKLVPLKSFHCKFKGEDYGQTIIARNRSSARYKYFTQCDWLTNYKDWMNSISVRCVGAISPSQFFGAEYDFQRMKEHRGLPESVRMGTIVDVAGKKGWITGTVGLNLAVMFEGCENPRSNCHPNWEVTYYDDNMNVILETKKN